MPINLPPYMTKVDNRLIRGRAVTSPVRLYQLKQAGVTQIVDLRNTSFIKRPLEKLFCKIIGIKYKNIKYSHRINTLPKPNFFYNVVNSIVENNGKTYIHCEHGRRRTGICVAMYEKLRSQKPINEIIKDMIKLGFSDVFENPNTKRSKKYYNILKDFMKTYCFPKE